MTAFAVGLALAVPACGVTTHQAATSKRTPPLHVYTFPLGLPANTLICAETARPDPMTACITLKHLRDLTRDLAAD